MGVTGIAPLVLAVGPLRNYSIFQQLSALNRTVLDSKEQLYACFLSGSCLTLTDIRLECNDDDALFAMACDDARIALRT